MADKKRPDDIRVLDEIQKIKNLERDLREEGVFPNINSYLHLIEKIGVTGQEAEGFSEAYSNFIGNYVSRIICDRLNTVYSDNESSLRDTPEGHYLKHLIGSVGEFKFSGLTGEDAYDTKISDLRMSTRARNCLANYGIEYVGQLVRRSERELLRVPNLGRRTLNEVKEILGGYGLEFGMDVKYVPPEARE